MRGWSRKIKPGRKRTRTRSPAYMTMTQTTRDRMRMPPPQERTMPRILAILIVYLIVFGAIVGLLYLVARTAIVQFNSLSGFVGGLLTPGNNSHPSPLENTLRSFGISSSQISSLRSQLLTRID